MKDDFLVDGAISGYRRPHEEVKELPKASTPAKLFRRRSLYRREHPDCFTDLEDDNEKIPPARTR